MSFFPGSPQTKSFIVIFGIALAGTIISLIISDAIYNQHPANPSYTITNYGNPKTHLSTQQPAVPTVNTSSWKKYANSDFGFSFLYDPAWTIKRDNKTSNKDYTVFIVDPGKKFDNFKLYISKTGYYAMAGLPTTPTSIGGKTAIDSQDILYGIHAGDLYYTLDLGASLNLTPEFNAWVKSFKFENTPSSD